MFQPWFVRTVGLLTALLPLTLVKKKLRHYFLVLLSFAYSGLSSSACPAVGIHSLWIFDDLKNFVSCIYAKQMNLHISCSEGQLTSLEANVEYSMGTLHLSNVRLSFLSSGFDQLFDSNCLKVSTDTMKHSIQEKWTCRYLNVPILIDFFSFTSILLQNAITFLLCIWIRDPSYLKCL